MHLAELKRSEVSRPVESSKRMTQLESVKMFVLQKLYKRMSDVAPSERALRIIAGGPRKIRAQIEVTIMAGRLVS